MKQRVDDHLPREPQNRVGRNLAEIRRPRRILRDAIVAAHQVIAKALETDAVAREEFGVVQLFGHQRMRQREHDRGIAVRARCEPFGAEERSGIIAHRTDVAELDARGFHALEPFARAMLDRAARGDLGVANRQAAEHHHQLGVRCDTLPTGAGSIERVQRSENVAHQHRACGVAVGLARVGEAADGREEPAQLILRVMEAARARPSVGTAEDRAIAVLANHPLQFTGHQIDRPIPRDLNEPIAAATIVRHARTVLQPALANRGPRDAAMMVDRIGNRRQHRRRIGIVRKGLDLDQSAILDDRVEGAPMRTAGRDAAGFRDRSHRGDRCSSENRR